MSYHAQAHCILKISTCKVKASVKEGCLHHVIQSKDLSSTDIDASLAVYPTLNTWTLQTLTDAENEELDCVTTPILDLLSYDAILDYLRTNYPLQSKSIRYFARHAVAPP